MDDDAALMHLVLANAQGELKPLEIGVHALTVVGKAAPGRGKKGGLAEYARQIGKTKGYLTQLTEAAEVLEAVKSFSQLNDLLDKAQHLAAIHAADRRAWPLLVAEMLKKEWSAVDSAGQKYDSDNASDPYPAEPKRDTRAEVAKEAKLPERKLMDRREPGT